jgi:hypothetical protein
MDGQCSDTRIDALPEQFVVEWEFLEHLWIATGGKIVVPFVINIGQLHWGSLSSSKEIDIQIAWFLVVKK